MARVSHAASIRSMTAKAARGNVLSIDWRWTSATLGRQLGLILATLCVACLASGCASIRQRLSHRSTECSQLCQDARTARDAGQTDVANQYLEAAMRRRPTDDETRLQLAEELWRSGRQLAAADEVDRLLTESPGDVQAAIRLTQMQLEIGRTEAAFQALQLALRQEPDHPEALRLKSILEERRGDLDAALATSVRMVHSSPDDVEAHLRLAVLYRKRGQPDRAAPLLRSASNCSLATTEQRQEALWQLGLAYADCQRWNDAHDVMSSVMKDRPKLTAEDWYQFAQVEAQCAHPDTANRAVQQALAMQPRHSRAQALAQRLEAPSMSQSGVLPAGFEPINEQVIR